jgi:hypothetical protein
LFLFQAQPALSNLWTVSTESLKWIAPTGVALAPVRKYNAFSGGKVLLDADHLAEHGHMLTPITLSNPPLCRSEKHGTVSNGRRDRYSMP